MSQRISLAKPQLGRMALENVCRGGLVPQQPVYYLLSLV